MGTRHQGARHQGGVTTVHNSVKEKLARGEVVASMTVRLVSGVEIVRIAKTAGFDSIYIDLEHSAFSIETTSQISIMALEAGIPAFVRVPAAEALPALNDATMVIVQFESAAALAAMDEIVAIEGVDMVMIGTNDLMADLGIPGQYEHAKVHDAYARTIAACRARGKHVGVGGFGTRPDLIEKYVKMGGRYVSTGTDLAFLMGACMQRAKQVRDIKI